MERTGAMDGVKIANLNDRQLQMLISTEKEINQVLQNDDEVYLIAYHKAKK